MTNQEFINLIKDGAKEGYKKYRILPSLIIAQAILESAWGKSHIENNLFGIKAGSSWRGKVAVRQTKEFSNGKWITIDAKFRAYNSFNESIEDHAKLLGTASRYKKVTQAGDYRAACLEVWKAGYATDPDYPKKLMQIIEQNKLYEYDVQAKREGGVYMQIGSKGNNVKKLQEDLNSLKYDCGKADGIFGDKTKIAVEKFQKDNKLKITGIVDNATLDKLKDVIRNTPSDWAKDDWGWGIKNEITDGSNPKNMATREEVISMIRRSKEVN